MWLLGRVLPYLVRGYVPVNDPNGQNYLQLLNIVDLLVAPEISENKVGELTVLIQEHHVKFVQLYSNSSIIPKHHFMILCNA